MALLKMTVIARRTARTAPKRRSRDGRPGKVAEVREGRALPDPIDPAPAGPGPISAARLRRQAVAPQDQAMYTCHCGFVFEAAVSTSVGCPHCGDAQAW